MLVTIRVRTERLRTGYGDEYLALLSNRVPIANDTLRRLVLTSCVFIVVQAIHRGLRSAVSLDGTVLLLLVHNYWVFRPEGYGLHANHKEIEIEHWPRHRAGPLCPAIQNTGS